jgi:hypothetical protein
MRITFQIKTIIIDTSLDEKDDILDNEYQVLDVETEISVEYKYTPLKHNDYEKHIKNIDIKILKINDKEFVHADKQFINFIKKQALINSNIQ